MMGFDADELVMVRGSLRHALEVNEPATVIAALLAEGWEELVATDPAAAITELAGQAGALRSPAPVLDLAILWGAGLAADAGTVILINGYALAGAERAERYLVVAEDGLWFHPAAGATLAPAGGFDPALGLQRVTLSGAGTAAGDAAAAAQAIAAGRRALAAQMVGASAQMLQDTVAYVVERNQYGRAIGSFQAVKHRLAEVHVAVTAARAGVRTAWEHADGADGITLAMAAKCLAGRAQTTASTQCFQVHGGIAFTVEHGFQQWVRRGLLLDFLLGSAERLTPVLGQRLVAAGAVPRVPDLANGAA